MIYVYRFTVGDTLDERRVWQYFAVVPSVVIVHFVAECYVGKNPVMEMLSKLSK